MSPPQLTATTFLLIGGRPVLTIDLPAGVRDEHRNVAAALVPFLDRGMSLLPGIADFPIPASSSLIVSLDDAAYELRDGVLALLTAPRDDVPPLWSDAAEELEAIVVLVGTGIDLRAATGMEDAVGRLTTAATEGRLVGSLVEFA